MSQKTYPKITVVTQCFNRAGFIEETMLSILNQNYPNLEYIVIDDGSTDGSWEIIQKYKNRLAHIEQLTGKRTSPIFAYNHGFKFATGEILATMNDKNVLMPKSLFAVAEVFEAFPQIEWLTGIGLLTNKDGIVTNVIPVRKDFYEHLVGFPWNMQHESTFWRKSLWDRTGGKFDEEYPWAFDAGLWRKFFFEAKLYHLNTILGAYRKLAGAQSTRSKGEFYDYYAKARQDMRKRAKKSDLAYAALYKILRVGKPILRNIPDSIFSKIPFFKKLCHESIAFVGTIENTSFKLYKRNPFRTMFPW